MPVIRLAARRLPLLCPGLCLGLCLLAAPLSPVAAENGPAPAAAARTGNASSDAPTQTVERKTELVDINASWPVVGIARVDDESESFVNMRVETFEKDVEELARDLRDAADKGDIEGGLPNLFPCELSIAHEVTCPSPRVVGILWNIWSFTGGAHGQLDIMTSNYDRNTGFPLLLEDLFVDPELAVLLFSKASRRALAEPDEGSEDGSGIPDEMLMAGTEPAEDNFRAFIVTPQGLRLHFQPYQVAPWAAGPQTVDVSLEELKTAKPRLEYWDQHPARAAE